MQRNFNFTAQTLLELIGIDGAKKAIINAKRLNCKNIAYAGTTYCSVQELEKLIKCTRTTGHLYER